MLDLVDAGVATPRVRQCALSLPDDSPSDYRELAAVLCGLWSSSGVRCIGLSGGQGAGKTTLCRLIVEAAQHFGERVEILSVDDFYLSKSRREKLAQDVHPLFVTRGPPSTHDIKALSSSARDLLRGKAVNVPVFDKGIDDRVGYRHIEPGADRVIVEGWCIGARAEPDSRLRDPVNALEHSSDTDGIWRRSVNRALQTDYQGLSNQLDCLVFLRVPDMDAVRKWRLDQEKERDPSVRMNPEDIRYFVSHYERLTRWMWDDIANRADVVVWLNQHHGIDSLDIEPP